MVNELVTEWECLKADCQTARLPSPKMQPGGLSDTFEISIPGHTKRITKDAKSAIGGLSIWVRGYIAGLAAREHVDVEASDCPIAEAAMLAKRVLDIDGTGGPDDHELLAKAVLQLTVALLEAKK